jgi:hypothetical protein
MKRLIASLLLITLLTATPAYAAAPYKTYHINMLYLTPLTAHTSHTVDVTMEGQTKPYTVAAPAGGQFLIVSFYATNRNDIDQALPGQLSIQIPGQNIVAYSSPYRLEPLLEKWLKPGQSFVGDVFFTVPPSQPFYMLDWTYNYSSNPNPNSAIAPVPVTRFWTLHI